MLVSILHLPSCLISLEWINFQIHHFNIYFVKCTSPSCRKHTAWCCQLRTYGCFFSHSIVTIVIMIKHFHQMRGHVFFHKWISIMMLLEWCILSWSDSTISWRSFHLQETSFTSSLNFFLGLNSTYCIKNHSSLRQETNSFLNSMIEEYYHSAYRCTFRNLYNHE